MSTWEQQINGSTIPYPAKRHLLNELRQDQGDANPDQILQGEDLQDLEDLHRPRVARLLSQLGRVGLYLSHGLAFGPVIICLIAIFKEEKMIEFVREGGIGMYTILGVGAFLAGRELWHGVRLMVLKDHSAGSLQLPTSTLVMSCAALLFLTIGNTVLDLYVVMDKISAGILPETVLMAGVKESMTPLVLGFFLMAIILFIRTGTKTVLHSWQAPLKS